MDSKKGSGKIKVLVIPGGPGGSHIGLRPMGEVLPKHGAEVYFYDPIDIGYSDRTNDSSKWNMASYVEHIEMVRKKLGLNDFFILGHSFGGAVAMEYAHKYPQHLKGLIISNMTYSVQKAMNNKENTMKKLELYTEQIEKENHEIIQINKQLESRSNLDSLGVVALLNRKSSLLQNAITAIFNDSAFAQSIKGIDPLFNFNQSVYKNFISSGEFESWDFSAKLGQLTMPTLMITGDWDYAVGLDDVRLMQSKIPHSEFVVCPNGTHNLMWTGTDCFFPAPISFLKKHLSTYSHPTPSTPPTPPSALHPA